MTHRILLADDSVTIRKVVELTFSDEDFQIASVGDGAQALERARTERPDIVISDVSMPGLNGYELCARLKADAALRTVPFLFLKGTFDPFDEEKARSSGADGIIVKPFESQEMVRRVKELISAAGAAGPAPAVTPSAAPVPEEPIAAPALPTQPPAPPRVGAVVAAPPAPAAGPAAFVPVPAPARPLGVPPPPPPPPAAPRPAVQPPVVPPPPAAAPRPPARPPLAPSAPPQPPPSPAVASPPALPPAPPPPTRPVATPPAPAAFSEEDFDFTPAEPEPAEAAGPDDDLWNEVNLRGSSSPIIDPVVGEDNLWGSLADASVLDERESTAPPRAPVPLPPALTAAGAAAAVGVARQPPPRVEETPARVAPAVDAAQIERLVAARLDAAVQQALEPLVAKLARALIEDVAWQVVPELAEAMIRAEIERVARAADAG